MLSLMSISTLVSVASLVSANDAEALGERSSNPLNSPQVSHDPDDQWRKIHFNVYFDHRIPPFLLTIRHHGLQPGSYATQMPISEAVPTADEATLQQNYRHFATPNPNYLPPRRKVSSQTFRQVGPLPPADRPVPHDPVFKNSIGDYKVVCYYDGSSVHRPAPYSFSGRNIDPFACTHVIYAFAGLGPDDDSIQVLDEDIDVLLGGYKSATDLKRVNPELKVMIAIGGWRERGSKFSAMVSTKERRSRFIQSAIQFLQRHQFDGLDLMWEYPGATERGGRVEDKMNFVNLVEELSEAFRPYGWILSAAVSPVKSRIDIGYDVPRLSQHLDFISIMTYDLRGHWDRKTGHHSLIQSRPSDAWPYSSLNTKKGINNWVQQGAPRKKLLMGVPFYGRSFTLKNANHNGPDAPAESGGDEGMYTRERGVLAYFEICREERNGGWYKPQDGTGSPYMTKGNQWVGWDDDDHISKKMALVRSGGLGGAMVWAIDLDDYRGECGAKWPLLKSLRQGLVAQPTNVDQLHTMIDPVMIKTPKLERKPLTTPASNLAPILTTEDKPTPRPQTAPVKKPDPPLITSEEPLLITPKGPIPADDYKVVCYFTNWAWYREGAGQYNLADIDASLCTHIVYAFVVLDEDSLLIENHDGNVDYVEGFFEEVTALKSKDLKVLISMGGWRDSASSKYTRLVQDPNRRRAFINNAVLFIQDNNFDGLEIYWSNPVCWQNDCSRGPASDRANFATFVKELRTAFEPHGLLLTFTISPFKEIIDDGFDVAALIGHVDWITVLSFDYHEHFDGKTGHISPLYAHSEDSDTTKNTNFTINYLLEMGAQPRDLTLAIAAYGRSFTLENSNYHTLNQKTTRPGAKGPYTALEGALAYYEICEKITNDGWTVVRDQERSMGPYAYKGNQWVGYDDIDSVRYKTDYIKRLGLGGATMWTLAMDDFGKHCQCEEYPLLKTINRGLRNYPENDPGCEPLGGTSPSPSRRPGKSLQIDSPESNVLLHGENAYDYKVVCYFTNWAWYREGEGQYLLSGSDSSLCTHIIYPFAILNEDSLLINAFVPGPDYDNGFYKNISALSSNETKVLISMGGMLDSTDDKYSRLISDPDRRHRFIEDVIHFIQDINFDGLDLAWHHPVCWQNNCGSGPDSDKANFATFVKELKRAFKPHGLLLSSIASNRKDIIDKGYDVSSLAEHLDWITVLTYDYHDHHDNETGHVAPLYAHSQDDDNTLNANFSIQYLMEKGAPSRKLVVSMPMFGRSFTLESSNYHTLNQKTSGPGTKGPYTKQNGFLAYNEICNDILNNGWTVVRDPEGSMGPYAYKENQWVGFDDIDSIRYKVDWIKERRLGGAMIWSLDLDDFGNRCHCETYPLLKTINRGLRNYRGDDSSCVPLGG